LKIIVVSYKSPMKTLSWKTEDVALKISREHYKAHFVIMVAGIGLVLNILNGCHLQLSQGYSSENHSKIMIDREKERRRSRRRGELNCTTCCAFLGSNYMTSNKYHDAFVTHNHEAARGGEKRGGQPAVSWFFIFTYLVFFLFFFFWASKVG